MIRRVATAAAALIVACAALGGCGSDGPSRAAVLGDLADSAIVPALQQFVVRARDLATATETLCATPSEATLAGARNALAAARAQWKASEAMWVGPVMERRSWAVIDWPIVADEIEALIADETIELDTDRLATHIGADQRGLTAVEYILGGAGRDGNSGAGSDGGAGSTGNAGGPLEQLRAPRRCAYLTGIAAVIVGEAELLPNDWTASWDGGEPYRAMFVDADGGGLDSIVNDVLFLLEAMTDKELGGALGVRDGTANLEAIVEGDAGLGVADLDERLAGVRAVLVGSDGRSGLAPLLGDELARRLTEQLDAAAAALSAIEPPLRQAAAESPTVVAAARDALKAVQVTATTEVVSRLGVTIGFSDADGDSAG